MEGDSLIQDIIFALATVLFISADAKQMYKIKKIKKVSSLSYTKYKLKIAALILMIIGYAMSGLYLSIFVSFVNLIVAFVSLYMMVLYNIKGEINE